MEPAKIDWKRIDSIFEEDKLYENINAPTWVDFLDPEDSINDDSWFCRPDCKHPKTAEDFLKSIPKSKFSISADKLRTHLSEWNQREAKLKRRGLNQASSTAVDKPKFDEDGENQNPNSLTPPSNHASFMKSMIKSSTEKKKPAEEVSQTNEVPRLRSTLSARNLFAGKDIMNQITEFCSELKKMAMRTREREGEGKLNGQESKMEEKEDEKSNEGSENVLREMDVNERDKERKPLIELGKEKSERIQKQRRKKVIDDAENIPISLNLANLKNKDEERLLQIRTNPPSPQCFSAPRPPAKTTPLKASKSRLMERGILQEVKQNKELTKGGETDDKGRSFSIVEGREARALDVFWFLKPCTLSS